MPRIRPPGTTKYPVSIFLSPSGLEGLDNDGKLDIVYCYLTGIRKKPPGMGIKW